ncbi:MAG: HIG1 domain-containing protein [Holosporales bacterium]
MKSMFSYLTIGALVATAITMILGMVELFSKSKDRRRSNQLMRWRVILQGITLALFAAMLMVGHK